MIDNTSTCAACPQCADPLDKLEFCLAPGCPMRDYLDKKHYEPPPIIGYACRDETGAWATIGADYMSKEDALATLANMVPGDRFAFSEIRGDIPGPPDMQCVSAGVTPYSLIWGKWS